MFGEEADGLGSGVEKEVHDLANEPGQQRAKLSADFFETVGHSFSGCCQTACYGINNHSNSGTRGKKDRRHGNAVFFSRRGIASSLSAIWVCSRASSSILSSILSIAASFSDEDVFVSSITA